MVISTFLCKMFVLALQSGLHVPSLEACRKTMWQCVHVGVVHGPPVGIETVRHTVKHQSLVAMQTFCRFMQTVALLQGLLRMLLSW